MSRHSGSSTGGPLPATNTALPNMRSLTENGLPILTIVRGRHGSGRREFGGEPNVPIVVALSMGYRVERRTQVGVLRTAPTVGAVTIVNPAERTIFTVEGEAVVLRMHVPIRLIEETADAHVRSVRSLFNEHDPAIERSAMAALVGLRDSDSHSDLLLHSIGYQLASILGQAAPETPNGVVGRGRITSRALRRVGDLVHARLDEPIPASPTLSELAEAAGVSKHHFIKAFRGTVGETPYAWVMRQRIERARALLTQPSQTVSDVAFQTGFSSAAHFVATFRQRLGITPGMFKEAVLA